MIEVLVKIKSDDITISERFLVYEPFSLSKDDQILKEFVKQALDKVKEPLENPDIVIKITYIW